MKKLLILLIALGSVTSTLAQKKLNDYKYVIVPSSYDFLKGSDQYQLNSLTKFLFKKYGFIALMESENFPVDLSNNNCLALKSNVLDTSGMFKTKLTVELRDCKNEIIFTSQVGETKEKDYKKAYNLALRDAFKSFEENKYQYKPNDSIIAEGNKSNIEQNQEIVKLKQEIKTLKEKKAIISKATITPKVGSKSVEKKVVPIKSKVQNQQKETLSNTLYAQKTDTGFQVVDSTPKVVMILLSTLKQDTYIVKGKDAIVYKEDGFWYQAESNGKSIITKIIDIKF